MVEFRFPVIMIVGLALPLAACGGAGSTTSLSASGSGVAAGGGLSAGGGGGGGGSAGGGFSAVAPNPGEGTYTAIKDRTGDYDLLAVTGELTTKGKEAIRADNYGFSDVVEYSAANNTYTLDGGDGRGLDDAIATPTQSARRVAISDLGGQLIYSRLSTFVNDNDPDGIVSYTNYGELTRNENAPVGVARYRSSAVQGGAYKSEGARQVQFDLGKSSLDLTFNFSTFSLDLLLNLIGTPVAGGADQQLGLFTELDSSVNRVPNIIEGFLVRQGGTTPAGGFGLRFYGPGSNEFGLSFAIGSDSQIEAAGAAAGRKE